MLARDAKSRGGECMLDRRLHLGLPLVLIAALSGPGASQEAASPPDRHHAEQCGNYYACIEHAPWQPTPSASADRSPADTSSGKTPSEQAPEATPRASAGWLQQDREESRP
jgi:hypothetical protein